MLLIIDLAERIGLGREEPTQQHVIIEVGRPMVGLLVSAVCDILAATEDMIQNTPDIAAMTTISFVPGLLTVEDRMLGLLRIDNVVAEPLAEVA